MIRFLSSLARLGNLLIDSGSVPDPTVTIIDNYYLCEITEQKIAFTYHKEPLTVPMRQAKTSGLNPNFLDENLKYFMGTKDLKGGDPFWELCIQSLKEAREVKILAAVEEFRASLKKLSATHVFTGTTKEGFYFVARKGAAVPKLKANPSRKNMESLGVMSDSVTIVMTYKGTPITGTTKVMAWWHKKCSEASTLPEGIDIVKGEPCRVSRLIGRISALDAPMVSFQKNSSFTFGKLKQANNFPVSDNTQKEFNAGMSWVTRKGGGQYVIISEAGPSKLAAGWWIEGCVDHPLLKSLGVILRGGDAMAVEEAWASLALMQLEAFEQRVNFAAWMYAKSRFALLEQWEVSANELIVNLLKFHSEFGYIKPDGHSNYDPVRWTIALEGKNKQPIVPTSCYLQCLKSVTTGSAYPDQIATNYFTNSFKWATSDGSIHTWVGAYFSRKFNIPMTKTYVTRIHTPAIKYEIDSPHPELRDFVGEFEESLSNAPASLTAYRYGLVLAIYGKIKQLYHQGVSKGNKFISIGDIPNKFRSPKLFMDHGVGMFSKYRSWTEANRKGTVCNIACGYFDDYITKLGPTMLNSHSFQSAMYSNLGWLHGCAYFQELSNHQQKTKALIAETGK